MTYLLMYLIIGIIITSIFYVYSTKYGTNYSDDIIMGLVLIPPFWGLAFPAGLAWLLGKGLYWLIYSKSDRIELITRRLKGEKV